MPTPFWRYALLQPPITSGLHAHFTAVAAATEKPVVLYDIPVRSGRKISLDTLLSLFEVDNIIVGAADAAGDVAETAQLIAKLDGSGMVYSGEDKLTLPLLAVGAIGVIGVATHWAGREMSAMFDAFARGDVAEARRLNALMIPSYQFETSDDAPNPVPSKVLMNLLGLDVGTCRSPMGPAPDSLNERATSVLTGLGRSL
ncbi:MAG: dihydrodipicolinate synthase family protein [Acidimicrobiales bacterium]